MSLTSKRYAVVASLPGGASLQSTAGKEVMLMSDFEILVIVLAIIELIVLITKNNRT